MLEDTTRGRPKTTWRKTMKPNLVKLGLERLKLLLETEEDGRAYGGLYL